MFIGGFSSGVVASSIGEVSSTGEVDTNENTPPDSVMAGPPGENDVPLRYALEGLIERISLPTVTSSMPDTGTGMIWVGSALLLPLGSGSLFPRALATNDPTPEDPDGALPTFCGSAGDLLGGSGAIVGFAAGSSGTPAGWATLVGDP